MRRRVIAALGLASIGVSVGVFAAPAHAATTDCEAKQSVTHGIYIKPCLSTANGVVTEKGTTVYFVSNPLVRDCALATRIIDYNTGEDFIYAGGANEAQCTANADQHKTWTPNVLVMGSATCTPGHIYYVWIAISGHWLKGGAAFDTYAVSAGNVHC
jgi:hypothetical protein